MKSKKKELDVDFIGGSEPLTREEEKRISDIIRSHKTKQKSTSKKPKTKLMSKKKVTA